MAMITGVSPYPVGVTLPTQALLDIHQKVAKAVAVKAGSAVIERGGVKGVVKDGGKPFDSMNNIVANLLLNLTR